MASTSAPCRTASSPAAQSVLPNEILEEIFLRLHAAADLARVSATCSSFRRIVSARPFLRRFRSVCAPSILGFFTSSICQRFIPVGPLHSSAPEARALEVAADFTFSFLPNPSLWHVVHTRDDRVLLSRYLSDRAFRFRPISAAIANNDFVVCDPLHRRYVKIPGIPEDLVVSTPHTGMPDFRSILAPAGEIDEEGSFRVICTVKFEDDVMAFVFSSCNQTWTSITTTMCTMCLPNGFIEYMTYYAHGCLYWMVCLMGYSLVLDTSEMEFSIIDLPPHNFDSERAIVEAEEGRLRFLTIADGTIDLYCKNRQRNGVGAQEWQHEKLIQLPKDSGKNYSWKIQGTAGRYLALVAHHVIRRESPPNSEHFVLDMILCGESPPNSEHFVLDMKTLLVEKLCTLNNDFFYDFPYARFPPPLALPSI